jgi:hypothetical protein
VTDTPITKEELLKEDDDPRFDVQPDDTCRDPVAAGFCGALGADFPDRLEHDRYAAPSGQSGTHHVVRPLGRRPVDVATSRSTSSPDAAKGGLRTGSASRTWWWTPSVIGRNTTEALRHHQVANARPPSRGLAR